MFQRYFDEGLAQASFLIACQRTREAVVIDPRRDVGVYLEAAERDNLRIVYSIETHIHADFVSGSRELAALGARTIAGPGSDIQFDFHEARDGEAIGVGDLALRFLHTPGHTPEHVSIVVRQPGEPERVFTGDTLFVGAVGRPDLLGEELTRRLAGELYDSLFGKLLKLDDSIEVHPGHGAGSLCGAGIGKEPHSTIGRERRFNPMLRRPSRDEFVAAVLGDLPETPSYFPRMKRVNREGPPLLRLAQGYPALPELSAAHAAEAASAGAWIIDLRSSEEFGAGHPKGAVNIAFGAKVGYWAGWIIPDDARIVLLGSSGTQIQNVQPQLLRVGLDRIEGFIGGGFDAWRAADLPVEAVPQIDVRELHTRLKGRTPLALLDVRTKKEFAAGHIEGALNVPVGELAQIGTLAADAPVATMCEGGFRSSLAASLLQRVGCRGIVNVTGGMSAYRAAVTHGGESAFETVRPQIDAAVQASDPGRIAQEIKRVLQDALRREAITLPERFRSPRPDTYARRLLHRDPSGRYTAVVMTWGPGQGTALHDHAGIWCVECVVDGEMEVAQYDLLSENDGLYRFSKQNQVMAGRGAAGCLIPPFEYHTLANSRPDRSSITLHIYGGEMDHCHVFEPSQDGAYRRVTKALCYHD